MSREQHRDIDAPAFPTKRMKPDKQTNPISDGIMAWNPTCPVHKSSPFQNRSHPMKRRKLTAIEKLMRGRHTKTDVGGKRLLLEIDHQSFWLEGETETKKANEWRRDMLAIALARIKP